MSSYLQVICFIEQHVPHLIWNDLIASYLSEFWTSSKAIDCNASIPPLSKRQLYQECYAPDDLKWLNQLNQYFYGKKTFSPLQHKKIFVCIGWRASRYLHCFKRTQLMAACTQLQVMAHSIVSLWTPLLYMYKFLLWFWQYYLITTATHWNLLWCETKW